ncbi:hypothetical protein ACWEO2_40075 [Nocardia sp. NPDC004278]
MMNLRLKPKSPPIADKDLISGELSERVQTARGRLAFQHDPALLDALSERELAANRELAERIRDYERREDLARVETAATAAERMRNTAGRLADQEADDLVTARQAIVEQRRQHSPHARLAWLHRRRSKVLRGLTMLMAFAMVFSAVTVQQNIAPTGGIGNPMWWLSYGLEGLISGMLIAIAISASDTAEWLTDERDEWKVRTAEVALLLVTIGLNTYPYIGDGNVYGVAVHMIAPVMIGFALVIHDAASKRYSRAIEAVTNSITEAESDITERLAELARLTDVPTTATRIESERVDAGIPVLEPATPHMGTAHGNTATRTSATGTATRNPQPATALEPAHAPARSENDGVRTATAHMRFSDNNPHIDTESARAVNGGAHAARHSESRVEDQDLTAETREQDLTSANTPVAGSADSADEPAHVAPETAHAADVTAALPHTNRNPHLEHTVEPHSDMRVESQPTEPAHTRLGEIADEVLRRRPRMRTPRELVIKILAAHESELPYTAIAKAVNVHRDSVLGILQTADKLHQGATVVALRKQGTDR